MTFFEYAKKYSPELINGDNTIGCPDLLYFSQYSKMCDSMKSCSECWNQEIDAGLRCAISEIDKNKVITAVDNDSITLHHDSTPVIMRKSAITSITKYDGKTSVVCGSASTTVDESYDYVATAVFEDNLCSK